MLTIILITFPLLFQIIAGRKAIGETISLKFGTVSILSILFQIVLSIIAFYITLSNFQKTQQEHLIDAEWEYLELLCLNYF